MGHAIFTEDGIEVGNIVQHNLAIYTRVSIGTGSDYKKYSFHFWVLITLKVWDISLYTACDCQVFAKTNVLEAYKNYLDDNKNIQ